MNYFNYISFLQRQKYNNKERRYWYQIFVNQLRYQLVMINAQLPIS